MEIGADGVGPNAFGERLVGGLPREASAAVADIEPDAALDRAMRLGQDPAVAAADPCPGRGERMGDDVARSHPLESRRDVSAVRDVGHQRDSGERRSLQRRVEGVRDVPAAGLRPEAHLHADQDVAMVRDDRRGLARPGQAHVVQLADQGRDQARGRDVEKGQHADGCRLDRVPAEGREVREAGGPRVDGRRHAAGQVDERVDAIRARVGPVTVEVDQAGRHDQPADVDHPVVGGWRHAAGRDDVGDPTSLDDDVTSIVDAGRRVDQPSTREDGPRHSRDRTHHREAA